MNIPDAFNVPSELRGADGTVYPLRKLTIYEQGQFARWLEGRAHDAVERSEDTDERKIKRHHLIDVDAGLGKYEWDGPLAIEAMWTPAGFCKIIMLVCKDQKVTDAKAEEILKTSAREIAARVLTKAQADPKARADLALMLGTLGLPMDWMVSAPSEPFFSKFSIPRSTDPSPKSPDSATSNSSSFTTSREAPMG